MDWARCGTEIEGGRRFCKERGARFERAAAAGADSREAGSAAFTGTPTARSLQP